MRVPERLMGVLVRVRLTTIPFEGVLVLMVRIMATRVSVCQGVVNVLMLMRFGEV